MEILIEKSYAKVLKSFVPANIMEKFPQSLLVERKLLSVLYRIF